MPASGNRNNQLDVQQTSYQQHSSEYDDPAQLERTMDDIAHDLAMDAIEERIGRLKWFRKLVKSDSFILFRKC